MITNPLTIKRHQHFLFYIILFSMFKPIQSQNNSSNLIKIVKTVPGVYYTPEAYSYFSRSGQPVPPQPPRETAAKAYKAAIELGKMEEDAKEFIPDLIKLFPKVVHVTEIRNAQYAGEGTFEDWLMTYITSEKNKFILSSPILNFNDMTLCESFIEVTHQVDFIDKSNNSAGIVNSATANIAVTFSFYIGACTLTKITQEGFGNNQQSWLNWFGKNNQEMKPAQSEIKPPVTVPIIPEKQSFSEILLKGTYRMILTTGDELTGIVEYKSDTSLILETSEGKPYSFRHSLIRYFELLQAPKTNIPSPNTADGKVQLTFDELQNSNIGNSPIEVSVTGGTTFVGLLSSINKSMLRINVDGSIIPITREAIRGITLIPNKNTPTTSSTSQNNVPILLDTVIVRNVALDETGSPKPNLAYSGIIQKQDDNSVTVKISDNETKTFSRSEIVRIIRNTKDNSDESIKRYAKQLFCPDEMFLVDMPPGKQGKPFFKVCVDRYEFPNTKGSVPTMSVSFLEAKDHCKSQGKRLCTSDEWQWACSGIEGYPYPYGWNRDEKTCNIDGAKIIEVSGARHNCVSKFGGYDMTGNIFEWVTGPKNEPALMGGPYSKCQTVSPGLDGSAKSQIGFRCCKSN